MSATDDNNRFRHFREDDAETASPAPDEDVQTVTVGETSEDTFDYIVPEETYKEHAKNKSKHKHKHKSGSSGKMKVETVTLEGVDAPDPDYVFASPSSKKRHHHHHHHHHHHKTSKFKRLATWKKVLIIVLSVLLALIIAVGGTYLVLNEIGRRGMLNYDNVGVTVPTEDESGNDVIRVDNKGRVITYDGVSYELNDNLISIAFIGADKGQDDTEHLQMGDAIYILTVDSKTGKVKILSISRDTMADVDLYSGEGNFIDTQRLQMAFAYAYGNEKVTGGKNTTTSISRLFYGLPFENYFAINLEALTDLNDAIGGVTLTSSMTFTSSETGRVINEGETVTLHGKEAEQYIRSRDTSRLDSNNDRMKRQQEYIKAFLDSVVPAVKSDLSVVSNLYDVIRANSDTTLDLPKMTYIASTAVTKLRSASDVEYVNLTGEITKGEYAEMHITNETAIRTMLDVFYTPLAKVPDTTK